MDLETKIRETILEELKRQFETTGGTVTEDPDDASSALIEGRVDLDALAMAIAGAMAGGP
ncbi:hypothetical protein [Chthonobacter rhizosphaerae]|uniref:hypothetical protein n=1 Tax=Chthonobacter rhizosphaerae TaxID=2735553 RepID=UPI0015EED04D|nr:hypothetical protein [Chthonobacter rhizosphaerae]